MNDLRKRLRWANGALCWWIVLFPLLLLPSGYWSVIGGRFCWYFLIVNGVALEVFREHVLERKVDDDMCRFLSRVAPLPDSVDPYIVCDLFRFKRYMKFYACSVCLYIALLAVVSAWCA